MSYGFNINGPKAKPSIIEAQSMQNNGGGGNLGYMQQESKGKEQHKTEEDEDIFVKENESVNADISLFEKIKNIFKKKK